MVETLFCVGEGMWRFMGHYFGWLGVSGDA